MKRSVAILGPTPQFVRWAIEHPCPLKEWSSESKRSLPDESFRQLRAVRELSVARAEGRLVEGFALHPNCMNGESPSLGFPADEVWQIHGDEPAIDDTCGSCPANATNNQGKNLWAGCYGWLPVSGEIDLYGKSKLSNSVAETDLKSNPSSTRTLVDLVESAVNGDRLTSEVHRRFRPTTPHWYGLWQNNDLVRERLELLGEIFQIVLSDLEAEHGSSSGLIKPVKHFVSAIERCLKFKLTLHAELIPAGVSDGITWETATHCPDCKFAEERDSDGAEQKCQVCGRRGRFTQGKKTKVLGFRPYIQLDGIVGPAKTSELIETMRRKGSSGLR